MQKTSVTLKSPQTTTQGYINLRHWNKKNAAKRGIFICLLIYGVGLFSIFNPVFHFLLPPVWIIVGPYAGYAIYKMYADSEELCTGKGVCPYCLKDIPIYPYGIREKFTSICSLCNEEISGFKNTAA
jgi:hypothetical protein